VDEAVDKMYRNLNRRKERQKAHHGGKAVEVLGVEEAETAVQSARITVERPLVEPLDEEDAIQALEDSGRPVYVFLNARNQQVNVVYRRDDGGFSIVEPRAG
jgi:putative sigma-54 modulation protein